MQLISTRLLLALDYYTIFHILQATAFLGFLAVGLLSDLGLAGVDFLVFLAGFFFGVFGADAVVLVFVVVFFFFSSVLGFATWVVFPVLLSFFPASDNL